MFLEFQKAYDSIDRSTLRNTLFEFGLDTKITNLICATLKNTVSKVKFRGELSESFEIQTGIQQLDLISPILLNCVQEKIIKEWTASVPQNFGFQIGPKKDNLSIKCLALPLLMTWHLLQMILMKLQFN